MSIRFFFSRLIEYEMSHNICPYIILRCIMYIIRNVFIIQNHLNVKGVKFKSPKRISRRGNWVERILEIFQLSKPLRR